MLSGLVDGFPWHAYGKHTSPCRLLLVRDYFCSRKTTLDVSRGRVNSFWTNVMRQSNAIFSIGDYENVIRSTKMNRGQLFVRFKGRSTKVYNSLHFNMFDSPSRSHRIAKHLSRISVYGFRHSVRTSRQSTRFGFFFWVIRKYHSRRVSAITMSERWRSDSAHTYCSVVATCVCRTYTVYSIVCSGYAR